MLLMAVKEDKGWLLSRWNLTYATGWKQICKAVNTMFDYYDNPEILVDDKLMPQKEILSGLKKRGI